jgi:DNA-binding GntR family transcriptional regulator
MAKRALMAAPPATPLVRIRLVDEITEQLRGLILDGTLAPGQQLRQVELAERLGVSRTPLREAFRVLERDGFLRIANANQTVEVVDFTPQDLLELYEIREVIDGLAARCYAQVGLSEDAHRSLESYLRTMEDAVGPLDLVGYNDAHVLFHTTIVSGCGNRRLCDLLPVVRLTSSSSTTRITRKLWPTDARLPVEEVLLRQLRDGNEHHRAILEAIAAREPTKAEQQALEHISITIKAIQRIAAGRLETAKTVRAVEAIEPVRVAEG